MEQSTIAASIRRGSPHAGLAVLGLKLQQLDVFRPVREQVQIAQKTVHHTPVEKLYDAFIGLLAGMHSIVELNKQVRADPGLQQAFGRRACAEQSVVQDTLDACTATNVTQLEAAVTSIYRQHSQGYRHDYTTGWQVLDGDMSGMPCGPKAAFATKGYFANQRNRKGRQLGRVLATQYHEVVVDRLFSGTVQLTTALQPLVLAAEQTLALDVNVDKRQRTIWRLDAGGGSLDAVNWLLERGYQVHCKDYSAQRARSLASSVSTWLPDPQHPGREVGWVQTEPSTYLRPVVRVAVRCRKANGQWGIGVLISTLNGEHVLGLVGQMPSGLDWASACLLAYVYFYDQRGGGVETAIKDDKQGLGLTTRTKKRFEAQQVLTYLGTLAHNVLVWSRRWVAVTTPAVRRLGIKRLVRDVWHISGTVVINQHRRIDAIVLNQHDRWARHLLAAFQTLLGSTQVVITLGET